MSWVYSFAHHIMAIIIDALLPRKIARGLKRGSQLSEVKRMNMKRIFSPIPFSLHGKDVYQPIALFKYKDACMKRCLWNFKYYLDPAALFLFADIYSDEIIAMLGDTVSALPISSPAHIIHAPSSSFMSGKRAWDQMHELSKAISDRMNADHPFALFISNALLFNDIRFTAKSQHESSRTERLNSSRDKFCLSNEFFQILSVHRDGKVICLDDVTTTGATFSALSRLIKRQAGIVPISIALCH